MSRYIDAQKLKGAMNIEDDANGNFNIMTALKCVDDAPTADVVEVRHGHWIENKEAGSLICSECGHFTDEIIGDFIHADEEISDTLSIPKGSVIHRSMNPIYCSRCGAKMDEEEQE